MYVPATASIRTAPVAQATAGSKAAHFAAFFVLEALVFAILPLSARWPTGFLLKAHAVIVAALLAAALLSRRSEAGRKYWPVLYALSVGGMAVLSSTLFGDRLLEALPLTTASASWIAAAKVSESVCRVVPILVLMVAGGASLRSMYLARGRLALGLRVGLAGFAVFAGIALMSLGSHQAASNRLPSLLPWILTFVLTNGFSEELLFRGILLRRYEVFLGKGLANLLAATVFTLLHARVAYVADLAPFLLTVFPLALIWGHLMQKTDSLWGPALFHAGADCLIILGVYRSL